MKVYNNKYQIYIRNRTNITFDKKLYEDHGSDWSLHNFDSFPWNIRDVSAKQKWCGSIIWSFLWETELAPNQLSLVTIDFLTWENTTCQDRNMSFVCRTRILQCRQIWRTYPSDEISALLVLILERSLGRKKNKIVSKGTSGMNHKRLRQSLVAATTVTTMYMIRNTHMSIFMHSLDCSNNQLLPVMLYDISRQIGQSHQKQEFPFVFHRIYSLQSQRNSPTNIRRHRNTSTLSIQASVTSHGMNRCVGVAAVFYRTNTGTMTLLSSPLKMNLSGQ